jgi:peptide/nickel transport system permease protein
MKAREVWVRPSLGRRLNRWLAVLFVLVAVFAPLLANRLPLVARVGGEWQFPALASYLGIVAPGPGDMTWKEWRRQLPPDSSDFAWMPPCPYGPLETDLSLIKAGPSAAHPLGNDDTGRDVLARLIHGTSTAVGIGVGATLLALLLGVLLGGLAGLRGGVLDVIVLRLIELFLCFPALLLVLAAGTFLGDSTLGLVMVLAVLSWTSFARIVRGELLSLRERDFVLCARGLGVPEGLVLRRHMLPQVQGPILVTAAFCIANAVILESTLSFLRLGPGLSTASWGSMLGQARQHAHLGAWHLWLFPALALVMAVTCCHVLADDLRDRHRAVV